MKEVKTISKKILSIVLTMMLVLSIVPISLYTTVYADDEKVESYTVTVLDKDNHGIQDAEVELNDETLQTDEEGKAEFSDVPVGEQTITVSKNGYKSETVTMVIESSSTGTTVNLTKLVKISGTITGISDDDVTITAVNVADENDKPTVSISEGEYSFYGLEGATYNISAKATNYSDVTKSAVAGADNADTDIVMNIVKQTIVIKIENNGTVRINDDDETTFTSNNSVTVDIADGTVSIEVKAGDNYHIYEVRGIVEYSNPEKDNNASRNAVKTESFTYDIDTSKTKATLEVVFEIDKYDIELVNNQNVKTFSYDLGSSQSVAKGTSIAFTIKPNDGYDLSAVLINNKEFKPTDTNSNFTISLEDGLPVFSFTYIVDDNDVVNSKITASCNIVNALSKTLTEAGVEISGAKITNGNDYVFANNGSKATVTGPNNVGLIVTDKNKKTTGSQYSNTVNITENTTIIKIKLVKPGLNYLDPLGIFEDSYSSIDINNLSINLIFDKKSPEIKEIKYNGFNEKIWSNESITVSTQISDEGGSELEYVAVSETNNLNYETLSAAINNAGAATPDDTQPKATVVDADAEGNYSLTYSDAQNKTYYLYAVDNAENVSIKEFTIQIDKNEPKVTGITFSKSNGNNIVFNELTFSAVDYVYSNGDIDVTVKAADPDGAISGIDDIELFDNGNKVSPTKRTSISGPDSDGYYSCTFTIKRGEDATSYSNITAKATDNAGNISEQVNKGQAEQNNKQYLILMSNILPTADISINTSSDYSQSAGNDSNLWFNNLDDRSIEFTVRINDNCDKGFVLGLYSASVKINDDDFVSKVYHKVEGSDESENYDSPTKSDDINGNIDTSYIKEKLGNGKNTISVEVRNNNGEKYETSRSIFIDKTAPLINSQGNDGVEIELVDSDATDKFLNLLSFGNFANNTIKISIIGYDNGDGSGINKIKLYNKTVDDSGNDVYTEIAQPTEGEVQNSTGGLIKRCDTFEISLSQTGGTVFVGNLYAQVIDNAGNSSAIVSLKDISTGDDVDSDYFVLEADGPVISSAELDNSESDYNFLYNPETAKYDVDDEGNKTKIQKWYGDDKEFSLVFADSNGDTHSGINNITASVNGIEQVNKSVKNKDYEEVVQTDTQTVDTSIDFLVERPDNGQYTIVANMQDNAGNKADEYKKVVYIDRANPEIDRFEFSTPDYQDGKDNGIVETDLYGYYFNVETTVTIFAKDAEPSSGVKSIEYKLIPWNESADDIEPISVDVTADNSIEVVIPEGFKGTIIAKATDNVAHTGLNYVTPDGVIFEKENPVIAFDILKDVDGNAAKEMDVKGDKEIFNNTVNVGVTVSDSLENASGIRKIEWTIEAPYDTDKNTSGEVEVPNVVPDEDTSIDGWEIVSDRDKNLIHEMHGIIPVENESNDIVVTVTVTDRSGNTSTESITFSIDRIAPVVTLTYEDSNKATGGVDNYYKGSRVAIITVKERNFDPSRIDAAVVNGDPDYPYSVPDISEDIKDINNWEPKEVSYDAENPDETTYVFKFEYSENLNGTMNFSLNMTDLAGNALASPCEDSFLMDNILPSVSVDYSCPAEVQNGYYYAAKRTATVTIVDHNFDNSNRALFVNQTTQKNNGDSAKVVPQPQFATYEAGTVARKVAKDTYQTVIEFEENAEYTFAFSIEDNAGNLYEYGPDLFDVDTALPILSITDAKKPSIDYQKEYAAYNDRSENSIIPVISIVDEDGNIDPTTIEVVLKGYKAEHPEKKFNSYSTETKAVTNGYEITINNFNPKSVDIDDIYTLSIVAKDLAGNELKYSNHISINRYGSNYTFDFADYTVEQMGEGAYVNKTLYTKAFVDSANPTTLFTEINCDFLDMDSTVLNLVYSNVKQQKQTEKELKRGEDYLVVEPDATAEEFNIKRYGYQLINADLFNEDGVYEIFATTHDAATNTNVNSEAVEDQEATRMILKFVVDNTAPRINIENSLEKFKYEDDTHKTIVENSSKIVDDAFSSDGKQATLSVNIDELNLDLDAVDINSVDIKYNEQGVKADEAVVVDGVYKVTFTLDAPDELIISGKPLVINIKDRAGNEGSLTVNDLLVSNNGLVRFLNNPYALYPTIVGLVLAVGAIVIFIILKNKKQKDDEEK